MNSLLKYATFLLVTISLFPSAIGIKCWSCRSDADPKCGYPFDNSTIAIVDCAVVKNGIPLCRKITQKVNGEWRYTRDCAEDGDVDNQDNRAAIERDQQFCVTRMGSDNITAEYCICNSKDGCNSSSLITPIPLMTILVPLIRIVFKILTLRNLS